jgi:hypothetical protein
VVAGTTGEGAALASFRSVGVGSASHYRGGHGRWVRCSAICYLDRRRLSQPLWWRERQVRALLRPLFARSASRQLATLVAGRTGEGDALACLLDRRRLRQALC